VLPSHLALLSLVSVAAVAAPLAGFLDTDPVRIQAEDRDRDAPDCRGSDGFRLYGVEVPGEGGLVLYFPRPGCWAEWDVEPPFDARGLRLRADMGSGADCGYFLVEVDGQAASTPEDCMNDYLDLTVAELPISAGKHTLRIATVIPEPGGTAAIDWLEFIPA
jgi:hypothetical protein